MYNPQKSFAPFTLYSLYLKLEPVTFPNVKKNVWNNTEILYGYVETNTQVSEFTRQLYWNFPKIHIFPQILQNAWKCIMFIDKTL